jgi:hypothetical protein
MPCTDKMKNKKYHNVGRIPQLKNGRKRQNRCIVLDYSYVIVRGVPYTTGR